MRKIGVGKKRTSEAFLSPKVYESRRKKRTNVGIKERGKLGAQERLKLARRPRHRWLRDLRRDGA